MSYDEMMKEYENIIRDWATKNSYPLSFHIMDVIRSILIQRDKRVNYKPGSFVRAVLANDLEAAIGCADMEVMSSLRIIVLAKLNISMMPARELYQDSELSEEVPI